jgi:hypothetical protein
MWSAAGLLMAFVAVAAPAWGQQRSSSSSAHDSSATGQPVVRTFGTEGGYRTEVTSRTIGTLSEENRRQASVLLTQVFHHIGKASEEIEAGDTSQALKEVTKAREALSVVRGMLPKTSITTKTTSPDHKVVYDDQCEIEQSRIPLYENLLHSQTLAPILTARRNALDFAGVRVVQSETIITEAFADAEAIDRHLARAAKALEEKKSDEAAKALAMALVKGIDVRYEKEDSGLAAARDAIWLARRSLEENNVTQALVNLAEARTRLNIYRAVLSQDERQHVDQMLREVDQLENQLRQEANNPATTAERSRQGGLLTSWWDRINGWFRRHF